MPVLSSFISYRPKRKPKAPIQVSAPFPAPNYGTPLSPPHPYASPRILDIHDGYSRTPPEPPEQPSYYASTSTPRVQLNMNLDPEPLTDWFPTNFFKSETGPAFGYDTQTRDASGSGVYYGGLGKGNGVEGRDLKSIEDETVSADDVLADMDGLDAMAVSKYQASNFVASDIQFDPPQQSWKKPTPTPIKIPTASYTAPKVQLLTTEDLSLPRPLSQVSSPESSAISGTTIARALMANSFILSSDTRQSRYRSGASTLTRTDSATLPMGEYAMLHSPYLRDRASMEFALSPGSAPSVPVPPIPGNAEKVYVPPQNQRGVVKDKRSPDIQRERGAKTTPTPEPRTDDTGTSEADAYASSSQARSVESSYTTHSEGGPTSTSKKHDPSPSPNAPPQPPRRPDLDAPAPATSPTNSYTSPPTSEPPTSARDLDNVLDYYSFADAVSPGPEPSLFERGFRLPFSPITEESSSQLSPPTGTPYGRHNRPLSGLSQSSAASKRSVSAAGGRVFLGAVSPASATATATSTVSTSGGARTTRLPIGDRTSTSTSTSTSTPPAPAPAPTSIPVPISGVPTMMSHSRSRPKPSISSIPESVTNSIFSTSTSSHGHGHGHASFTSSAHAHASLTPPPPQPTIFNRLRAGAAPSPIKVIRDAHDARAYDIALTPGSGGSGGSGSGLGVGAGVGAGKEKEKVDVDVDVDVDMQQTFPETPDLFSPSFSPPPNANGKATGDYDYLHMAVPIPTTPLSAFLPIPIPIVSPIPVVSPPGPGPSPSPSQSKDKDGRDRDTHPQPQPTPSLAQQMLLTRAATSVHGARHSRQASLSRLVKQQQQQQQQGMPVSMSVPVPKEVAVVAKESTSTSTPARFERGGHGVQQNTNTNTIEEVAEDEDEDEDGGEGVGEEESEKEKRKMESTTKSLPLSQQKSSWEEHPNTPLRSSPAPPPPRSPLPNTPFLHPAAPVLGTVSLPQVTPEPPPTPAFSVPLSFSYSDQPVTPNSMSMSMSMSVSHASEESEAVLAYDYDRATSASGNNSVSHSRAASVSVDASPKLEGKVLARNGNANGNSNATPSSPRPTSPGTGMYPTQAAAPAANPAPSPLRRPNMNMAILSPPHPHPHPQPLAIPPPAPAHAHTHARTHAPQSPSSGSLYSLSYDPALSPPPYAAVMVMDSDHHAAADIVTPSTSESFDPTFRFGNFSISSTASPHSPPPSSSEFVLGAGGHGGGGLGTTVTGAGAGTPPRGHQTQSMIMGQGQGPAGARTRSRPPLPAGPRRPSQLHGHPGALPIAALMQATRERGGSVSSVSSQLPSSLPSSSSGSTSTGTGTGTGTGTNMNTTAGLGRPSRQPSAPSLLSPQFVTPPPKWKGFTMEAAKWTFTSTQLQGIVSRAIRQSSEASSIRLLQLETLDTDIPEEVEHLQTLRTDTITRYKTYARRRANLLDALMSGVDARDPDGAFRQLQELKDISGVLDKATQDLHSLDEQLAQLAHLTQVHSTSALAMALRKLNASFLKQFAEAQNLRQQVESLQAERDEAWQQAVEVANDYDDLRTGKIESPDTENRFNRVMAVRKLSTRAAKAGLRSAGSTRSNHRVSAGSGAKGLNLTASSSKATSVDDIPPPVPPIPRRRPVDIKTNLPLRNSTLTGGSTTELSTPNSETRAMVRAQEELYEMLGIPTNDRARRSRSVIGLPGDSEPQVVSPSHINYDAPPHTGRRASLPPSARLQPPDPYYALTANASIIWTSDRSGWI
ncbi:hypothetical protein H0H92_006587 [Tricholoma furcatifolium]|nr:hypothetical protein H0H92_006587 [Tricholoma furcatifolium]